MLRTLFFLSFGLGSNYLFNILLARDLGAEQYGVFSLALATFNIAVLLSVGGLDQAAVRFIPYFQREDSHGLPDFTRSLFVFGVIGSAISAFGFWLSSRHLIGIESPQLIAAMTAGSALLPLLTIWLAILQGHHLLMPRLWIKYCLEPGAKIGIAMLFLSLGWGALAPAIGMVAAFALALLALLCLYSRYFFHSGATIDQDSMRSIAGFCWPLIAASAFTVVAARADTLIVGHWLSKVETGQYAVALQSAAILAIVLQAIEMVSTSRFSAAIAGNRIDELQREFAKATRWSILLGLPIGLTLITNAETFIKLFGEEFQGASAAFAVLCVSQLCNLATGPANPILIMAGATRTVMRNDIFYGVAIFACVLAGTMLNGLTGAAWGAAIANSLLNIWRVRCVWNRFGIHPYSRYLLRPLGAAAFVVTLESFFGATLGTLNLFVVPSAVLLSILILGLHTDDHLLLRSWIDKQRAS